MILPTEQQCLNYFQEYQVPENIFKHCLRVQSVANFLAKRVINSGIKINSDLLSRLALLHDLFKMIAIANFGQDQHQGAVITKPQLAFWQELKKVYPNAYEGEVAYDIFKEKFPELATALSNVSNPKYEQHSWEEKIVHYADMRVFKDQVVTLKERWAYLQKRYPREPGVWEQYWEKIKKLEQSVMLAADLPPEQLKAVLDQK